MRFAAGKQVFSAESGTRNGRQVCYVRFAAKIPANPAFP